MLDRPKAGVISVTKVLAKSVTGAIFGRDRERGQFIRALCLRRHPAGLALAASGHESLYSFTGRFSLVQDGVHLLGDRHLHATGACESDGRRGGEDAFGDHAVHAGNNFRQLVSAPEFDADAAVAREAAGTSENQVTESCQTSHGFGASSTGYD